MVDNDSLRKAQLIENDLLKKFREICQAEGMPYYLLGGTALGARRHKGFIPWDDDIDVGLVREDYDRFLSVAPKYLEEDQIIEHYSLDESYQDYTMKLSRAKVSFLTQRENTVVKQHIWIDIFPLDGAPDNRLLRWLHFRRIDFYRMQLSFHYIKDVRINEERPGWQKALVFLARHIPIGKLIHPTGMKKALVREFRKYRAADSKTIGNYMGAYREREFLPVADFGEGTDVEFEGEIYKAPRNLDGYLTNLYGDYMQFPPKEQQVPKHRIIDVVYEK